MCYLKVSNNKSKMNSIKTQILSSTAKFLLYKQKLKNLLKIHSIIKNKLLNYVLLFQKSKKLKSLNKFSVLYKNTCSIQSDIQKSQYTFKKRNLIVNDILLMKAKVYNISY